MIISILSLQSYFLQYGDIVLGLTDLEDALKFGVENSFTFIPIVTKSYGVSEGTVEEVLCTTLNTCLLRCLNS